MNKQDIIERAISNLANTMRMYGEVALRYNALFEVDPEEAIDNIDRAFEMKLENFYTLYDVSKDIFPYFKHGDTSLLIAIRNSIHHPNSPLFISQKRRLHLEGGSTDIGASYFLGGHPTTHGGTIKLQHHIRLDDLDALLNPAIKSQYLDTIISITRVKERFDIINNQLSLDTIRERARSDRYPTNQVYLDLMPIFVSAVCKVFTASKAAGMGFKGFDAQTYEIPFTTELEVDLSKLEFKRLWFRGLGSLDFIPIPLPV